MQNRALFSESFLYQPSILARLKNEFAEASREFREDPKDYVVGAIKGDGIGGHRRRMLLMYGFSIAMLLFVTFFIAMLIMWQLAHSKVEANKEEELIKIATLANLDDIQQPIDMPKADKKAGGGGGGGRKTPTPPSKGQLPKFSLQPPIIAPRPEPQLRPPALPTMETVQVDPRLEPRRDELAPTGLPTGVIGPPSAGPGTGGGMGSGDGGGMGTGDGRGVGPGRGYNMGGGDPSLGGGNRNTPATSVDVRPIPLNRPRPNYTEEARKNKIQGVVVARVLVGADGSVRSVKIVRHLPDGLDEEAISAVYKMRFKPAMKNGQPVAFWQNIEVEFNLR
ncbi:MAG: TonB family protein [Blastocatellia bacterium]|nr:TonB family protein [Blastocatellia bacterium]